LTWIVLQMGNRPLQVKCTPKQPSWQPTWDETDLADLTLTIGGSH
jgi:hypothetical protein